MSKNYKVEKKIKNPQIFRDGSNWNLEYKTGTLTNIGKFEKIYKSSHYSTEVVANT